MSSLLQFYKKKSERKKTRKSLHVFLTSSLLFKPLLIVCIWWQGKLVKYHRLNLVQIQMVNTIKQWSATWGPWAARGLSGWSAGGLQDSVCVERLQAWPPRGSRWLQFAIPGQWELLEAARAVMPAVGRCGHCLVARQWITLMCHRLPPTAIKGDCYFSCAQRTVAEVGKRLPLTVMGTGSDSKWRQIVLLRRHSLAIKLSDQIIATR